MRPSDDTREHTLARLRRGYVAGRLHTETFTQRVDRALQASCDEELAGLTADLPAQRTTPVDRLRAFFRRPGRAHLPPLDRLTDGRLILGRSSGCELVFSDDTVSRRHAELRIVDGRWMLRDLGSSNGTWVNGRRVMEAEVAAGDDVSLGHCRFRL
jgi:pSer/pThr/pTyr-binding forkhead associated (FHA) protein